MPIITSARFAAATSVVALVVSMSATGYAAVKISGKQIKNNAITSKKVKNDSLTGSDVKESTLGIVPSATNANNAGSAGKVNGMTPAKVFYRSGSVTPATLYTGGGLTIQAACTVNALGLLATTSKANSSIYSHFIDVEGETIFGQDDETQDFQPGENHLLLGGADIVSQDPGIVTFVYDAPDGSVVTGTLSTDNADGGADQCSVTGTVTQG
jgi:hypothetical protein